MRFGSNVVDLMVLVFMVMLGAAHAAVLPPLEADQTHQLFIDESAIERLNNTWQALVPQLCASFDQLYHDDVVVLKLDGSAVNLEAISVGVDTQDLFHARVPQYSLVVRPEKASGDSFLRALTQDNPTAAKLSVSLQNVPMSAHVYVSGPGRARALQPHTDGGDLFVYQLHGRKRWSICTPPCPTGYNCTGLSAADRALMADVAKKNFNGKSILLSTAQVTQNIAL